MARRYTTLAAVLLGTALTFTSLRSLSQQGPAIVSPDLLTVADNGPVLAIVRLNRGAMPEAADDLPVSRMQQAADGLMDPVIARHQLGANPLLRKLTTSPSFRAVLTRDQILALAGDPAVLAIQRDRVFKPSLIESVPFSGAPTAWNAGITGTGWTSAVIDTGVDGSHPFLLDKVVAEACFGTNQQGVSTSLCRDGTDPGPEPDEEDFTEGAGEPCPHPDCDHGTHVAGILAGDGTLPGTGITIRGMAPDATLIAMQVFSRFDAAGDCDPDPAPCIGAFEFDWERAVDRLFVIRNNFRVGGVTRIGAVNLSLGRGAFTTQCGDLVVDGDGLPYEGFANLRNGASRIPTVAAVGNDGLLNAISLPACHPDVISVGSTAEIQGNPTQVSSFSNRASFLTLMAPGSNIQSSVPGGTLAIFSGTSMAAPHVSGALTLLRQHAPATSITNLVATLRRTGEQIPDSLLTYRRLRLDQALRVPFVSDIFNATTPEDTPISLPFTVHDLDTPLDNLTFAVTSSNTTLLPQSAANITVIGSAGNRALRLTPAADASGTSVIALAASDGPRDSEPTTFTLTVTPVNDAPVIMPSSTNVVTPVGQGVSITVVVSDSDSAGSQLTLTAASLNQSVLPNANILVNPITSTASTRTFQVTMTPAAGAQGSSAVTLTARDGPGAGAATTTLNIVFTAGAATGAPTISAIAPQATSEDTPLTVSFTVGDPDTPVDQLVVTASSSNSTVVAQGGLLPGGAGASRSLRMTPVGGASGTTTITAFVSDGSVMASTTFLLTVQGVNNAPVITGPTSATTTPGTPVTLTMTVTDADSAGNSLDLIGFTNHVTLLPGGNITIVPTTTGPNSRVFSVILTPVGVLTGQATVTLIASDDIGSMSSATIVLVVSLTNEAPLISFIPNQSTPLNTPAGPIPFTISDAETPAASLTVSGVSSNPALLPNANIVFGGSGGSRTVTLTPAGGQIGSALVTLTVSDGARSSTMQFTLTVTGAPPEAPTSIAASASGNVVAVSWTRSLTGPLPTSYVLEIGTSPGATTLPTQSTGDTSLLLALPDGTFYFRVRAVNSAGISGPSPEASAVVGNAQLIPGPPSNFAVTTVGAGAVLTWSAPTVGAAVATYIIEAGSGPGAANLATLTTGSAATSYHVPFVPPGTYFVRVRAANLFGVGAPSQDVAFTMGGVSCTAAPGSPVLFTPVVAGNAVTLSWNAPAAGDPPSSYVLMAGSTSGSSNIAVFDTLSSATSFAAPVPNGTYFVRVASRNPCGDSAPSNEMSFTIGTVPPGAPSALSSSVLAGTVTLTWAAPVTGDPPTGYVIEAGSAPGQSNIATVPTGSTATTFSAPAPSGTYFVRVRAVNAGGSGPVSDEVVVVVP